MAETARVDVEAAGRTISVSNPEKVFFPERGETKLDLVRYYLAVEEPLMRAMRRAAGAAAALPGRRRRTVVLPEARARRTHRTGCRRRSSARPNGTTSQALVVADLAHVVWAVNLGCLGFHVWPYRADDPEHADELRIDLDPSPGVTFARCGRRRREVTALLDELGIDGLPEDHRQPRHPRLRAARAALGRRTRCAPPRSPSPASSSGAGPI